VRKLTYIGYYIGLALIADDRFIILTEYHCVTDRQTDGRTLLLYQYIALCIALVCDAR